MCPSSPTWSCIYRSPGLVRAPPEASVSPGIDFRLGSQIRFTGLVRVALAVSGVPLVLGSGTGVSAVSGASDTSGARNTSGTYPQHDPTPPLTWWTCISNTSGTSVACRASGVSSDSATSGGGTWHIGAPLYILVVGAPGTLEHLYTYFAGGRATVM